MGGTEKQHHHNEEEEDQVDFSYPFFTRPIQRQRWGDVQEEPHTNWGDAFFDLFYVAAAYNLGNLLRDEPTSRGVLYFVACFWPIMLLWFSNTYYDTRFYTLNDVWHTAYNVAVLVALATAVLHIRTVKILSALEDNADMFTYCLAVVLLNFLVIGRFLEVSFFVQGEPVARVSARRDVGWICVSLSFYVAAMIAAAAVHYNSDDNHYEEDVGKGRFLAEKDDVKKEAYDTTDIPAWLLCAGSLASAIWVWLLVTVWFPKDGGHKKLTVPMNVNLAIHRYGEWTMLMMGEGILSLLIVELVGDYEYYKTFFCGIVSMTLLQYLHFQSQPHSADEHAIRRSKEGAIFFTNFLQIQSAALIVLGASYKMLLFEQLYAQTDYGNRRVLFPVLHRFLAGAGESGALLFDAEDRRQRIAHFFAGSMAIVWLCSDAMIIAHRGLMDNLGRCRCKHSKKTKLVSLLLVFLRGGLLIFMATLSQYETRPSHLAFLGLAGIVAQLVLRVVGNFFFPHEEQHHFKTQQQQKDDDKWPNVTRPQAISQLQADAKQTVADIAADNTSE